MKVIAAIPRRAVAWLWTVAVVALVHMLTGRILARSDLVSVVLVTHDPEVILAAPALVMSRMFLYFLAPGWAVYIAVRTALERRVAAREARPAPSDGGGG